MESTRVARTETDPPRGEKRGKKIGRVSTYREAILEILETRFGSTPASLASAVNELDDPDHLKDLLKEAVTTPSLEALEKTFKQ